MLKHFIFAMHTRFLCSHLPYITNLRNSFRKIMTLWNRMVAQVVAFLYTMKGKVSRTAMKLEFSHVYHHANIENNLVHKHLSTSQCDKYMSLISYVMLSPLNIDHAEEI